MNDANDYQRKQNQEHHHTNRENDGWPDPRTTSLQKAGGRFTPESKPCKK